MMGHLELSLRFGLWWFWCPSASAPIQCWGQVLARYGSSRADFEPNMK